MKSPKSLFLLAFLLLATSAMQAQTFTNAAAITIPSAGNGNPYPSTITVSNVQGTITKATVTLNNLNHEFPDDIDILLVGPTGASVLLMSDAGGGNSLTNVNLTFDDGATSSLSNNGLITSGTYLPTNFVAGDTFPAPAPAAPYGSALSVFNGTNPNGAWRLFVVDDDLGGIGSITGGWTLSLQTFSNFSSITIPDVGNASPYPSTINVSGVTGTVSKVTVRLNNINHTFPDDIDILLVGPTGASVVLMSDAGGDPNLVNVNLTFDDNATAALPNDTIIASGTYRPTNYEGSETFPSTAPAGPYGTTLAGFNGVNPNGAWRLFIVDDTSGDSGAITGGWSLGIETSVTTAAEVSVSGSVITPDALGLTNAIVTLTGAQGSSQTTLTGKFGSFKFNGLTPGETYVISVSSKRYAYAPQVFTPTENFAGITFAPLLK